MSRRAMLVLATVVAVLVSTAAAFVVAHRPPTRWEHLLVNVRPGMSLDEAIAVMGKPGAIAVCGIAIWHDDATHEHIQIHFDHNRNVVATEACRPTVADRLFSVLSFFGVDVD